MTCCIFVEGHARKVSFLCSFIEFNLYVAYNRHYFYLKSVQTVIY